MKKSSKYIGLDVHKETIAVAVAEERGGELRYWGEIENRPCRRSASAIRPSRADSICSFVSTGSGGQYNSSRCGQPILTPPVLAVQFW